MYMDKLDYIENKYNNAYNTIKMKPVNVKSSTYIDSSKEITDEDPIFKIGDIVRISKFKIIFGKGYTPNLKPDVGKLDLDKLKNVPSGLSNLKDKVDKLDVGN